MNHLVTKATITSRLSLTADYLPRMLRKLETGGLIQLDKRSSILLDMQRRPATARFGLPLASEAPHRPGPLAMRHLP